MAENAIQQSERSKSRIWELDFVRGICVILMVLDHIMYSIMDVAPFMDIMLGKSVWDNISLWIQDVYWYSGLRTYVRFLVLGAFFIVCGTSCSLSRSNFKRGALCFLVGCGVSCVTVIIDKIFAVGISIYFGVLHMLGVSILVYALLTELGKLICKLGKSEKTKVVTRTIGDYLAPIMGVILLIVYFTCFFEGIKGDMPITNVKIEDKSMSVLASLFVNVQYSSIEHIVGGADFWPLFPWLAIVLVGGFVGVGIYKSKARNYLARFDGKWNKPVCFVGRHALLIYVAHQVAAVALLFLITLIA